MGMTINSFTSVSLLPPLILFCVELRNSISAAFRHSGHFALHFLTLGAVFLSPSASPRLQKNRFCWPRMEHGFPWNSRITRLERSHCVPALSHRKCGRPYNRHWSGFWPEKTRLFVCADLREWAVWRLSLALFSFLEPRRDQKMGGIMLFCSGAWFGCGFVRHCRQRQDSVRWRVLSVLSAEAIFFRNPEPQLYAGQCLRDRAFPHLAY